MALPPEVKAGLYINGIPSAKTNLSPTDYKHAAFTGTSVSRAEQFYTCKFDPGPGPRRPGYQISANKQDLLGNNFLYVENIQGGVAAGILPIVGGDRYVYSENYGGCEFHVLAKAGGGSAAFLHVYRGGGALANYTITAGSGWTLRGTIQSAPVVAVSGGMGGASIVSFAFVPNGLHVAECCMLTLDNQGMVTGVHQYQQVNVG